MTTQSVPSSPSCNIYCSAAGVAAHAATGSLGTFLFTSFSPLGGALYGAAYGVTYTLVHLSLSYFVEGNSCLERVIRQVASLASAILAATVSCTLVGFTLTLTEGALLALSMVATTILITSLFLGFVCCCLPCCLPCCVTSPEEAVL